MYDRLVAERGDIPTEVRTEAEKVLRNLEQVIRGASTVGNSAPAPSFSRTLG
ncbi:hypothetical protein [Streptomyces gilvosporeus]|uniref:hypothetical protein n=1 Tax=Streptomyces gilvosporeus TaxID=553510 RepID=UPI0013969F77|nr:hypothetical protein [Streptomyces gilvosporeus]